MRLSVLAPFVLWLVAMQVKVAGAIPWPAAETVPNALAEHPSVVFTSGVYTQGSVDPRRRTVFTQKLTLQGDIGDHGTFAGGLGWVSAGSRSAR